MLIVIHVLIAITSLVIASASVLYPSRSKLRTTYALVVATLLSGTVMVVATHAPMLSSCMSGLSYLAVAVALSAGAEYRLRRVDH